MIPATLLAVNTTVTVTVPATITMGQSSVPPGNYSQLLAAKAIWSVGSCSSPSLLYAGSQNFTFTAKATVAKSCNITTNDLIFPPAGDLNTPIDGQTTLNVQCTKGTPYTIGLNGGTSGATDPTARLMKKGTESIRYGLYQQAGGVAPWGATSTIGGTGNTFYLPTIVYGRVPVQPTPSPGTYTDTIIATVTY